jgi:hypothetical protein
METGHRKDDHFLDGIGVIWSVITSSLDDLGIVLLNPNLGISDLVGLGTMDDEEGRSIGRVA